MCFVMDPKDAALPGLVVAGLTCLAVVVVVEALMGRLARKDM